jgi:hypothetical protein
MEVHAYFAGHGSGASPGLTGLEAGVPNPALKEREVFRIDLEPDERVRKLTGFKDGAQMRKVFSECHLDELLGHMRRDRRLYKRARFDTALGLHEKHGYVGRETLERTCKHLHEGMYGWHFDETASEHEHHSRVPDINVFGLVCVVVFGGLDFGTAACLPYFNLSEQQTALLFNNAVRVVAPALSAVWAPRTRSRRWLEENCRPPDRVETELECEDDIFAADGAEEQPKLCQREREAIYHSDLVFLIDGMDRKCQHSANMLDQAMEYGVKTQTLQFHAVRWCVVSNLAGHVVFRTRGAAHSIMEINVAMESGFFEAVDNAFEGVSHKHKIALVCDRGYYKLPVAAINKRMRNVKFTLHHPVHLNVPHVKVPILRGMFDWDEAELNIAIAEIRAVNEIANLHIVQCGFYDRTIPLSLLHSLMYVDEVADSLANIRADAAPEPRQK